MNKGCQRCSISSHLLNGLYCKIVDHYVEHSKSMPCVKTDAVVKAKCKQCIWKREMLMGLWCDLHNKDTNDIEKCNSFDGGRNYDR